jgi:hypothetical protein
LTALVIEVQSEPEGDMLERLAEYVIRLRREVPAGPRPRDKYEVAGALLNLTGPPQPAAWDMAPAGLGGAGLNFRVVLRTLREESAGDTLAGMAQGQVVPCLLPWIPLMTSGGEAGIIEEWKRLAGLEPDGRLRANYAGLALVFAELADCRNDWKRALEGWNVRQSQQVLEWQAEARAEARVETARAKLLRLLQLRFGSELTPDFIAQMEAQTDLAVLDRWFDQAYAAPTLNDFRAALT